MKSKATKNTRSKAGGSRSRRKGRGVAHKTTETEPVVGTYSSPGSARDMYLVYQLRDKSGTHYCSVLVRPSKYQYYDFKDSHANAHMRILSCQLPRYHDWMSSLGFSRLDDPFEDHRPEKYYFIIEDTVTNCHVKEVSVVNNLHKDEHYSDLLPLIPFEWIAEQMFVGDYKANRDSASGKKRNNIRWDAGYTGVDSTDPEIVPEMNMPSRIKEIGDLDGHGDDPSREHTLFMAGCAVMACHERVVDRHADSGIESGFLNDETRQRLFCQPWRKAMGLGEEWDPYARFEGTSAFACGDTEDFRFKKTELHVDQANAKEEGHNHSPTITALVEVTLSDGCVTEVLVGVNIYQKHAISDAMFKLYRANAIKNNLSDHLYGPRRKKRGEKALHKKFERPPNVGSTEETWTFPADDNKDGYYALFVNEILPVANSYGRNEAMMVEMLYSLIFTPCPKAWMLGFRLAATKYGEQFKGGGGEVSKNGRRRRTRGKQKKRKRDGRVLHRHFLVLFIEAMKELDPDTKKRGYGRTSWHLHRRVQHHLRKEMTYKQLHMSLRNLRRALKFACTTDNSRQVVRKMDRSLSRGGVHFVGQFWGQTILHVATKIQLVTNPIHMENAMVSTSTTTYDRLVKQYGSMSDTFVADLVPWLSRELNEKAVTIENGLCEMGRVTYGTDDKDDVFVAGHVLYECRNGRLQKKHASGRTELVPNQSCEMNNNYEVAFKWWEHDFDVVNKDDDAVWNFGVLKLN